MSAKPIPDGHHTLTPHLVIQGCADAMEFYKRAFGAEEIGRMPGPGGKIMHAELKLGDSILYLCDEFPEHGACGPQSGQGSPVTIHMYVPDADAVYAQALEAGATETMPLQDTFWGDRYGKLRDPFGHHWSIATHKEDLTLEQIQERAAQAFGG